MVLPTVYSTIDVYTNKISVFKSFICGITSSKMRSECFLRQYTCIVPLIGHCVATWYAVFRYFVKLMELGVRYSDLIATLYLTK